MSYTPGPWRIEWDEEADEIGYYPPKVFRFPVGVKEESGERRTVCVFDDDYGTNQLADANLIAATPDLLEALYDCVMSIDLVREGADVANLDLSYSRARKAIAKAEGKVKV